MAMLFLTSAYVTWCNQSCSHARLPRRMRATLLVHVLKIRYVRVRAGVCERKEERNSLWAATMTKWCTLEFSKRCSLRGLCFLLNVTRSLGLQQYFTTCLLRESSYLKRLVIHGKPELIVRKLIGFKSDR